MQKKILFLMLLALAGLQLSLCAQAPILQKSLLSEIEYAELKTQRPFFRDTLNFRVLKKDLDGTHKIVEVSLVLASEFMCAVETWNTACGFPNGRVIVYIEGGVPKYYVSITRNSDGVEVFKDNGFNTKFEKLDLKADTYKVWVYDSKSPPDVHNEYILNAAEVKSSSAPEVSLTPTPAPCGQNGKVESFTTKGVGPYTYLWSNGATTKDLLNVPAGTYTLTVSDANFCTDVASATVFGTGNPVYSKPIERKLCSFLKNLDTLKAGFAQSGCDSFTVFKNLLATTKIDTVKSNTCDTTKVGVFLDTAFKHTGLSCDSLRKYKEFTFKPKVVFWLYDLSCNPKDTGDFFVGKFQNQFGCDSLVWKHIGYAPKGIYTFETIKTYCAGTEGTDTTFARSQNGCDSNHVITRILEGVETIFKPTINSCFQKPDSVYTHKSFEGCDSLREVTHFNFVLVRDTTIYQDACDVKLKNKKVADTTFLYGCQKITTTIYLYHSPQYTSLPPRYECSLGKDYKDTLRTGSDYRYGCDSFTVQPVRFVKPDTIYKVVNACRVFGTGHYEFRGTNRYNCDSLFIQDTFAYPSAVSQEFINTCDKSVKKVDTTFRGKTIFGCDTFHILFNTILKPSFGKVRQGICKEPILPKNDTVLLTAPNSVGCDSFSVIEYFFYPETKPTEITDSICGIKRSETISEITLQNQYGCDSVVKRKLITLESPVLKIDGYTHPTSKWNGSIDLSVSKGTAPWTLYDGQGNEVSWEQYDKKGGLYPFVVVDANGCWDSLAVALSDFWAYTQGRTIHLHGGLADDELVNDYYGGEEVMIEVYDGQSLLETRKIQNIRLEFDLAFPKLTTAGIYYFRMVFPNQPKHYLVTKAVIQ